MLSLRCWSTSHSVPISRDILLAAKLWRFSYFSSPLGRISRNISSCMASFSLNEKLSADANVQPPPSFTKDSPISGVEDELMAYMVGKKKATEVAHSLWKQVVRKGDRVVDATCGNGYDTLGMLNLVADESGAGCVYGLDIQKEALESTSSLLDENAHPQQRELVKLFNTCHSRMEEVVPRSYSVRLQRGFYLQKVLLA